MEERIKSICSQIEDIFIKNKCSIEDVIVITSAFRYKVEAERTEMLKKISEETEYKI